MKFSTLSFIILFAFAFAQCKKHQFKPDHQDPDLPSYTENGDGFGGAYINDSAWLTYIHPLFVYSQRIPFMVQSYPTGDSIVLVFDGDFKAFKQTSMYPPTLMFIVLKNIRIEKVDDLVQLNDYTYTLDGVTRYGGICNYYGYEKKGNATGQISFGKVEIDHRLWKGDGSTNNPYTYPYALISGRFNMDFSADRNYSITKGRFDFHIEDKYSFFVGE